MIQHPPRARYVLEGRVATMSERGVINDGAVYIDGGTIEHLRQRTAKLPDDKYRGATRIRTGGTIFPGFIELHNHLSYNAMPLWEVPTQLQNNGQWRGTEPYTRRITKPSQVLGQSNAACSGAGPLRRVPRHARRHDQLAGHHACQRRRPDQLFARAAPQPRSAR